MSTPLGTVASAGSAVGARGRRAHVASWSLAALSGFALAGAILRLSRLEGVLGFDDLYTVATANRSFLDMLAVFRFEANGTLYAVLLWPLLRISESEEMVRAPAVVAGIATVPAVYWAGRTLVGQRAALFGAALAAVSPALIRYSVTGRGYALAILFATLSFGCLMRALDDPERTRTWRRWYVLSVLAMAYSSATALAILPVQAAAILSRERGRRAVRAWLGPSLALAAGLLPLFVLTYVESTYRDPLHWLWKPDLALVRQVVGELTTGSTYRASAGPGLTGAILVSVVALALVGVLVARARVQAPSWGTRVILGWLFFPPLFLLVLSQVRPFFWDRYLVVILPAFALLVGVLLARLPKLLRAVCGAIVVSLLLVTSLVSVPPYLDYRAYGSWVEAHRQPGDPLVLYPVEQLTPLSYYARTLRVDGVMPAEEWNDTPLPAGVVGYLRPGDWGDSPLGPPRAGELSRLADRSDSMVILVYGNLAAGVPLDWAENRGCTVERTPFGLLLAISIRDCDR